MVLYFFQGLHVFQANYYITPKFTFWSVSGLYSIEPRSRLILGSAFQLVGSNQATGLVSPLRRKICRNPVWMVGCGPRLHCAHTRTVRARYACPAHPANWIQINLTTRWRTKSAGLIESYTQGVGSPPQTPGQLRRKNEAGFPPGPRWGSAPNPAGPPTQTPLFIALGWAARGVWV